MWNYVVQDVSAIIINGIVARGGETSSAWLVRSDTFGLLDLNFSYQDGAVHRFANVPPRGPTEETDERLMTVPRHWNAGNTSAGWLRVPTR